VKRLVYVLSLVALWSLTASWAQVLPPNEAGVSMGHLNTIVRDVEATKKFWELLGATAIQVDGTVVMKTSGMLVFLTPGSPPPGGNRGTPMEHIGVNVRNAEQVIAKLKAAGVRVDLREGRTPVSVNVSTPDGLVIEMERVEEEDLEPARREHSPTIAVADHLHYRLPESVRPEAQAWYGKLFGAIPLSENNRGQTLAGDIPGIRLRSSVSKDQPSPTRGRAVDRIGFEVKDLEAFCKKLEAAGMKFVQPYSKTRHKSYASAEITDPWGTSIELTEGLNRF